MPEVFPAYVNQTIYKNFRLEIWNTSQGASIETNGCTIYTSKLQGQDYRYAADAALVNTDAEVTNFQSIVTVIPVPTAGISQSWRPGDITSSGGNLVNWKDEIWGTVLTPSGGTTQVTNVAPVIPDVSLVVSGSIAGTSNGNNIGAVCVLFNVVILPAGTQTVYSNGNGVTLSINAAHKLVACGTIGNVVLSANTWYLVIMDPIDGYNWLINLVNEKQLDFWNGGGGSPDTTITIGSPDIAIADVTTYTTNLITLQLPTLVGYYATTYFPVGNFALPLTFPSNAVSQTN
jgi:hypothetical protein